MVWQENIMKNKIIVILGPTSSGKTGLAVKLAYKFNGEIIGADSRQVYKGMDIGTGKDLDEYNYKSKNIPYHLIDVVKPMTKFDLAKYQKLATRAIENVLKRGKLPIVVGGTGLYLESIVNNYNLSSAKPDEKLRQKLEKLSTQDLLKKIEAINPDFAKKINNSDRKNKRRLIRYIEIVAAGENITKPGKSSSSYDFLILGITHPRQELKKRIYRRLLERLEKEDMVGEVRRLHNEGVTWKRMENFGLEYKFISKFLRGRLGYEEMVDKLNIAIRQFAKRQMTWFRRWEKKIGKIYWIKNYKEAEIKVKKFIN